MTRPVVVRLAAAVAAALCVWSASSAPLWRMTMRAPQYPHGLTLTVYGTRVAGDVSELTILNHYIGMPPVTAPDFETMLFPYGIAALLVLCFVTVWAGWPRRLALAGMAIAPLAMLADLQWRLYVFGHTLNPKAPIRLAAFTPLVIGQTSMGNFKSIGMVSAGFWLLVAAVAIVYLAERAITRQAREKVAALAAVLILSTAGAAAHETASVPNPLQERIDAALPGGEVHVPAGIYQGPIVIRGPLTLIAAPGAVIDGGGRGSVVTIQGHGVTFEGFSVRNSGREVTEEAAGISVSGDGHRIARNRVTDVYFGIHLNGGTGIVVAGNDIAPGERHGARPGHGITAWNVRDSRLETNRITAARDGIYLSFTERLTIANNIVDHCRYGLHSMYSADARVLGNTLSANLLGAALMMSTRLTLSRNRIEHHREGAAAYGLLLKDIGEIDASDNRIVNNRIAIYAEGVGPDPAQRARFTANVIAGNEVGFALQSTASFTVAGNDLSDNLTDVRPLGRRLSERMQWTENGRGNYWSLYRGYDANGDGLGDLAYQVDDAMDALVQRNDGIRAFLYTPAHRAIDAAVRMFPVFRQPPVLIDGHPLIAPAHRDGVRP